MGGRKEREQIKQKIRKFMLYRTPWSQPFKHIKTKTKKIDKMKLRAFIWIFQNIYSKTFVSEK